MSYGLLSRDQSGLNNTPHALSGRHRTQGCAAVEHSKRRLSCVFLQKIMSKEIIETDQEAILLNVL